MVEHLSTPDVGAHGDPIGIGGGDRTNPESGGPAKARHVPKEEAHDW